MSSVEPVPEAPREARPRLSRPITAVPFDAEVSMEIKALLVQRLTAESPRSDAVHVVLVIIAGAMAWPWVPHGDVYSWIIAVTVAALGRGLFRRRAVRSHDLNRSLSAVRLGVAACGVAWGAGVVLIGPQLPAESLAWITVIFAGLISGATVSLLSDPISFYVLVVTLLGPLTIAVRRDTQIGVALATFVVVLYGVAMAVYFRRSHRALVDQFLTAKRLEVTERAARNERAMLDALVDGAPNAIAVVDDAGAIIRVNESFGRLFGISGDDAIGRTLNDLVSFPGMRAEAEELDRRVRTGEIISKEAVRRRKDGTAVHVRISAAPVKSLGTQVTFVLYDDITEQRRAREAESRLVKIIEAATDMVGVARIDGPLQYMNAAGRRLLGFGENEDLATRHFMDVVSPASRERLAKEYLPFVLADGTWSGEIQLLRVDGSEVTASIVIQAQRGPDGAVSIVSCIARDVSQQVATRDALRAARDAAEQATHAKSAFLANTSHEVRTPLNGILGMVELLLDTELTDAQRRSAELIASSGEALLSTINDLLDVSKIEAQQLELEDIDFDLHHVLHSAVRLFMPKANKQKVELVSDVGTDVPQHVRGDPHRLRQVLTNLVGNAVKFTRDGEVVVSARTASERDGWVAVDVAVRDTGIGIAPANLERIFEPFKQVDASTTRQFGGTGLGLTIARQLVRMMGGELAVNSRAGTGTTFSFTLSLPRAAAPGGAGNLEGLKGLRALVVDDHETNRRIICEMLRWAGCEVAEARTADDALTTLREGVKQKAKFRILVSDVQMPTRDGFQLAEDVRSEAALRDTRIMLLTSAGQRGDGARCRELGVAAYMLKPVSRVELLEAAVAALRDATYGAHRRSLVTRHTIDETRKRMRILLAEDNPVNQEVASAMLRQRGHEVVLVADGRAAVKAARKGPPFDVILMDLQMPELGGLEATKEIRGRDADTPIVALTANVIPEERTKCLAGGMNAYLSKPFKAHELFGVVEGWAAPATPTRSEAAQGDPVDLPALQAMLADAGIESAGEQMLKVYLESSSERVALFAEAARKGDLREAESIAHQMKSSSASIFANRLAELFRQAEAGAQAADTDQVRRLGSDVAREYARVSAQLEPKVRADR